MPSDWLSPLTTLCVKFWQPAESSAADCFMASATPESSCVVALLDCFIAAVVSLLWRVNCSVTRASSSCPARMRFSALNC